MATLLSGAILCFLVLFRQALSKEIPLSQKSLDPVDVGGQCTEVWAECKSGLVCHENVCKRQVGDWQSCTDSNKIVCKDAFHCVGPSHNKKCMQPRKLGRTCGKDPYRVCKAGLTCVGAVLNEKDGICKKPSDLGTSCKGRHTFCINGRVCGGWPRLCRDLKHKGETCGSNTLCDTGLTCHMAKCKTPLGFNKQCGLPDTFCAAGRVCAGKPKTCRNLKGKGETCGKISVCESGLICHKTKCKTSLGDWQNCTDPKTTVCRSGFYCVGPPSMKKCMVPRGPGHLCGQNAYIVCVKGWTCMFAGNGHKTCQQAANPSNAVAPSRILSTSRRAKERALRSRRYSKVNL